MVDSKTQQKLDKLDRIEQRRRARARRFLDKVKGEGRKQISAIISGAVYEEIVRRKNASQPPLSTGQVIEQAVMGSVHTGVNATVNIDRPEPPVKKVRATIIDESAPEPKSADSADSPDPVETSEPAPEKKTAPVEDQPESANPADVQAIIEGIDPENLTIKDRDRLIFRLYETYPGQTQAKDRIKVLNDAGILLNGEPWTTKRFADQLTLARRRAKK